MSNLRLPTLAAAPPLLAVALALALIAAPGAGAAERSRFVIRGAGWGHGVGMSQWGAMGMARQGWDHRRILAHYYTGTALGTVAPRTVRVLIQQGRTTASFTGATRAGARRLVATKIYGARRAGPGLIDLLSPTGRRLARMAAPMVVRGTAPLTLRGRGVYRGRLEIQAEPETGVYVVNALGLESYIRGIVARESPSSWPAEALQAQAVAARTYAVTTSKNGAGYEHVDDTRSQVYGGVGAETPTTDAAVAATRGQVVTYGGQPVVTYFFSTSGGKTENVENGLGGSPQPWLKSVDDPYDDLSPRHRWGPIELTLPAAGKKLRGLVQGGFRGIEVLARGASPRIVAAEVVGTRGRTRVTGAQVRQRLGLWDTWAYFTTVSAEAEDEPEEDPADGEPNGGATGGAALAGTPGSGSLDAVGAAPVWPPAVGAVAGRVLPARRGGKVTIERLEDGEWEPVAVATTRRSGRYRVQVSAPGRYRPVYGGVEGPSVRVG